MTKKKVAQWKENASILHQRLIEEREFHSLVTLKVEELGETIDKMRQTIRNYEKWADGLIKMFAKPHHDGAGIMMD